MLCTPVFIFTCTAAQLFQGTHTLWFINLSAITCHIQYTFLSLCPFLSRENRQNTKILEDRNFHMIQKWPPTVTTGAQSINTERTSLKDSHNLLSASAVSKVPNLFAIFANDGSNHCGWNKNPDNKKLTLDVTWFFSALFLYKRQLNCSDNRM